MAKKNWQAELDELVAANKVNLVADNKFMAGDQPLRVRDMNQTHDPLEAGDTFTIPADYKVVSIKFNPEDKYAHSFIFVEVTCADGSERNYRLFPNSFCRVITPLDDKNKPLPRVKTTGTASEAFRSCPTDIVDDAIKLLVGRKIRITKADIYTVRGRDGGLKNARIYQYDFVD